MAVPTRSIYVGNIPFASTSETLMEAFAEYQPISVKVVDGRGVAFIEVPAKRAYAMVRDTDGSKLEGRLLSVSVARPRENEPSFTQDQHQSGGRYQERPRQDEGRNEFGPGQSERPGFNRDSQPRSAGSNFQNRNGRGPNSFGPREFNRDANPSRPFDRGQGPARDGGFRGRDDRPAGDRPQYGDRSNSPGNLDQNRGLGGRDFPDRSSNFQNRNGNSQRIDSGPRQGGFSRPPRPGAAGPGPSRPYDRFSRNSPSASQNGESRGEPRRDEPSGNRPQGNPGRPKKFFKPR